MNDGKLSNRSPAKGMEGTVGAKAVDMAQKAAPALKRAGRAGNVLSFGISAHEQWEKDSHNPSMGDGEKVARATTRGLGSAAGGWAGGLAGAKVGAAVGARVGGPVGARVGGPVGARSVVSSARLSALVPVAGSSIMTIRGFTVLRNGSIELRLRLLGDHSGR